MNSDPAKILVTGGAGFIGSAFVRKAVEAGLDVLVLDSLSYAADLKRLSAVRRSIGLYKADICDRRSVEKVIKRERVGCIINFAAETHVDRSIKESLPFLKANVLGVHNLLELVKEFQIAKFIQISTDEVYGEINQGSFSEDSPLAPNSPYAASKAGADLLIRSYIRTYGLPALIIRPSNNYGPWQYPEKFIPFAVLRVLRGQTIPVYGQGRNIREWLYVDDCAEGILEIFRKGEVGQIYNLGGDQEKENIEIARSLARALGKDDSIIEFVKDRPGHDLRYRLDCQKVGRRIGFKPKVSLEEGLKGTVDWCLENKDWMLGKYEQINKLYKYE